MESRQAVLEAPALRALRAAVSARPEPAGVAPSLGAQPDREAVFAQRAEACAEFLREHGALSSPTAEDTDERRLGRWINAVRTQANKPAGLKVSRAQVLEQKCPEIMGQARTTQSREQRALIWAELVHAAGRLPRRDAKPGTREARDAAWLNNARHEYRRGELPENIVAILRGVPGALETAKRGWDVKLAELRAHVAENGHPPTTASLAQ